MRIAWAIVGLAALGAGGCVQTGTGRGAPGSADTDEAVVRQASRLVGDFTRVIPWGSGPGEVGIRRPAEEFLGGGPTAVTVGPDGALYLLDAINQRVLQLARDSQAVVAQAPFDAEDLAVGPDSTIALYSQARARVWVDGQALPISRLIPAIREIGLDAGKQVTVTTAHQETLTLGSPGTFQSETAMLRQRRAGAFFLPDGRGVAVRLDQSGHPEILTMSTAERSRIEARVTLPEQVLAARLVGQSGTVACLRLEQRVPTAGFVVTRKVVCHDVITGARSFSHNLGRPGWYVPRREVAFAGSRLAVITPEAEGLRVHAVEVPTTKGEVQP